MKAAIYNPNSKETSFLELSQMETPVLNSPDSECTVKNNGAIIKVRGCGVCGSDLLKLDRNLVKAGTVLGHEVVGEILEISEENSKKYNLKKGERIISSHHVPCGACTYCLNGRESLCKQFKATNFKPGAFAEYIKLSEGHLEKTVLKVPESLSDIGASFTEPVACCLKAIKKSGLAKHKGEAKVIVIGLGSIGQILGQLINLYLPEGCTHKLIGCDLLDNKLELAKENGFNELKKELGKKNIYKENSNELNHSESADFIFLASGANPTIDLALENIRDGGTIVVFSSVPDKEVSFTNNDIYYRELSILSSYSPNLEDLKESLELIKEKKVKVDNLISHVTDLDDLGKTIKKCRDENGTKVFLKMSN